MPIDSFEEFASSLQDGEPSDVLDALIARLREQGDYHRLFDALLLRRKIEMGLSGTRPSSLEDVPDADREAFEQSYIDAAREAGRLFLEAGKVGEAWAYFRTIREPEPVREALENMPIPTDADETTEDLINVALYEEAHPVRGLEVMLHTHGTCNTVTAMDQHLTRMSDEQRAAAAAMLVRTLYADLCQSVHADVSRRVPLLEPNQSLRELIAGREWLFEENNYHIDVSHLSSVVRFARALGPDSPELQQAVQLAAYGRNLAEALQYPAEPPFDEFYEAHWHYFRGLLGQSPDESINWYRQRLTAAGDDRDRQMIAYVLVDLLRRMDRLGEAVEIAAEHLDDLEDPTGFSFAALCQEAGAWDRLLESARRREDQVTWVAALLGARGAAAGS